MPDYTFKGGERLKSRKLIGELFEKGQSFGQYPLRLVWIETDNPRSEFPVQMAISVPKRRFKHAVTRNLLKRRIREAYRLRKHRLYRTMDGHQHQWALMIIYTGKEPLPSAEIATAMDRMLGRFIKKWKTQRQTNPPL